MAGRSFWHPLSHSCYSIGGGGMLYLFTIYLSLHILQMKKHPWIHPFSQWTFIKHLFVHDTIPETPHTQGKYAVFVFKSLTLGHIPYCFLKMCALVFSENANLNADRCLDSQKLKVFFFKSSDFIQPFPCLWTGFNMHIKKWVFLAKLNNCRATWNCPGMYTSIVAKT